MFSSYFKIALRSITKNKVYSLINIIGLTVGIACGMLITLYIKDEWSYDRYNQHYDETYRVVHDYRTPVGGKKLSPPAPGDYQVWGNAPVADALKTEFPEVKSVARFTSPFVQLMQHNNNRFQENNLVFADPELLDIFSWKIIAGDKNALRMPNSIVLTRKLAVKYFGKTDIVGEPIKSDDRTLTVTAVLEDIPANSHFTFDGLVSMSTFQQMNPDIFKSWGYVDFYTYFTVAPHSDIAAMVARIPGILKRDNPRGNENGYSFTFEPLKNAYLFSEATRQPGATGSVSNILIFSLVAVFMLFIAGINFVNLSTARSLERAKEIGVRKVVGAFERSLIFQYLTEAVMFTTIATVLALLLCFICIPAIRQLADKALPYSLMWSGDLIALYILTPLIIGIPAGIYPALVLAKFKPALVLKGKFAASGKGQQLRKGLVVFQFSLSIALIAATTIVFSQLKHLQHHELGFSKEQLLVINYGYDATVNKHISSIKQQLAANPAVKAVTASRGVPGNSFPNGSTGIATGSGEMEYHDPSIYEIDEDFIGAYNIKMAAGRTYSISFPADMEESLVMNEAATKLYGFTDPAAIIGKRFEQWGRKGTVIGVVKDFNYESLHKKVAPLVLRRGYEDAFGKITLRLQTDNLSSTIKDLERTWNEIAPQRPFLYSFLDESFNKQYLKDERFGEVFAIFGGLTILIACLGLFGLATYATEKRLKEIGVRKVLGASSTSIITLLTIDFIQLILIAILIATPLAWYAMHKWLDGYAYRVGIHWWAFAAAGFTALAIAALTVGLLAMRAARANPVKALRAE